jgi:hypothetical protein
MQYVLHNSSDRQYEHILELYYDTADALAVRNSELMMCQDHLREAQSCLEQWRSELLRGASADRARQSVVSDSVLLERQPRGDEVVDTPSSAEKSDHPKEDLDNPKRVSRRLNQSVDLQNRARITPVLHRRKSSRLRDAEKPVPKPRHTVSREKAEEETGNHGAGDDITTPSTGASTCLDPDLLKDLDLGVTSPLRMSYMEDPSQVDILKIDDEDGDSSSGSDDTLLPSVRENCVDDDSMDTDTSTLCGSYDWSHFEDRPRTNCGRPLTGERRLDACNDRPPTRSGMRSRDVAASYAFEGQRPPPDSPVDAMRSTMDPSAVSNGHRRTKTKIVFKEIKSDADAAPIKRPLTPHVRACHEVHQASEPT